MQCFGLTQYGLSKNNLASLKYENNWVKIISLVPIVGNREIGLQFLNNVGSPFFLNLSYFGNF